MTPDPHTLLPACRRGDRTAQRQLFEAFAPEVFRTATRYLPGRSDAEDVVQETFLRVFRGLNGFDESRGSLGAWIHRIGVNESLRALGKRERLAITDSDLGLADTHVDPAPLSTDILASAELRALILRLPPGYRAVFNLFEVEGYAHEEVATMLDISAAASRSQLTRAKRQLRQWVTAAARLPLQTML